MNSPVQDEQAIFETARHLEDSRERTAYLDEACSGDAVLRQRIEALLAVHDKDREFLKVPAVMLDVSALAGTAGDTAGETAEGCRDPQADAVDLSFLTPSDEPGSLGRLGRYEIRRVVGAGGMGVVLQAFDQTLHRVVAIKVMAAPLATSGSARQRFIREARAAAAVRNDHVVGIHDVESPQGQPYLVMEYIEGVSLQQRLDQTGPLELREILRIGMQIAHGLAAAHAQGVVHRDIKPANILLENGVERVKITDFGLARAAADVQLTHSGLIAGTPSYMAPEQALGERVDHRADLFSLGSVLYALCTGHAPFRGSSAISVLKRVCEDRPCPIRDSNPLIPEWLAAIVERLHAKQPADRFQSAAEVAQLLSQQLAQIQHPSVAPAVLPASSAPQMTSPAVPSRAARTARLWSIGAIGLICLVVALGLAEATGITHLTATIAPRFEPPATAPLGAPSVVPVAASSAPEQVKAVPADLPFAVLGSAGERSFKSLEAAVKESRGGETIEIRASGRFAVPVFSWPDHPLALRAAPRKRPVLVLDASDVLENDTLLEAGNRLVLEGLEIQHTSVEKPPAKGIKLIGGRLQAANCRFVMTTGGMVLASGGTDLEFRNCELLATGTMNNLVGWICPVGGRLMVDNCVLVGAGLKFHYRMPELRGASIRVTRSTIVFRSPLGLNLDRPPTAAEEAYYSQDNRVPPIRLDVSHCVFSTPSYLFALSQNRTDGALPPLTEAAQCEVLLPKLVALREVNNVYATSSFLAFPVMGGAAIETKAAQGLADWQSFWKSTDTTCRQTTVRFAGGNLEMQAQASERVTPQLYRVYEDAANTAAPHAQSASGAVVELVGPGEAFDHWRTMPDYQVWQFRTGQKFVENSMAVDPAIPGPQLLAPPASAVLPNGTRDGKTGYTWTFSWAAVPGADRYEVEVSTPAGMGSRHVVATTAYRRVSRPGSWVNTSGDWNWRVRACRGDKWGSWSQPRPFQPAPPAEKTLTLAETEARLRETLRLAPTDFPARRSLAVVLRQQLKLEEAQKECWELVKLDPGDISGHVLFAAVSAQSGHWKEAEAALTKATTITPYDHMHWYRLAVLRLHLGDRPGYDRVCLEMIGRFENAELPEVRERTAKTCLLSSDGGGQLSRAVALTEPLMLDTSHKYYWYFTITRGLAEYRTGRHAEAIARLERTAIPAQTSGGQRAVFASHDAAVFAVLALAQHAAGRTAQARQSLTAAERTVKDRLPDPAAGRPFEGDDWHDWLMGTMLLGEARQALGDEATQPDAAQTESAKPPAATQP